MSNQPTFKKVINVMTTAALTAGVVAPIVAPMEASANSTNLVDKVLYVDNDYTSGNEAANHIVIKEDDVQFATGDTFRLSLPSGVKWDKDSYTENNKKYIMEDDNAWVVSSTDATDAPSFEIVQVTDQDLELKIAGKWDGSLEASVNVPMFFEVDGAEGELKVTVDAKGSTLTAGQYTFAVVSEGKTSTTVSEVKNIGDGDAIGTIRIDELALDTLEGEDEVSLRLPNNFEWEALENAEISITGAFTNSISESAEEITKKVSALIDGDKLTFNLPAVKTAGNENKLTTIYISGLAIDADKDAAFGEIEVEVSGDNITDQDIVVANYADYSSEVEIEDEIPTLLAGRDGLDGIDTEAKDLDELETVEVTLKESVVGSWITGRDVHVEFPTWVKVKDFEVTKSNGFHEEDADLPSTISKAKNSIDDNEFELSMPKAADGKKREVTVKFFVSTKADAQGDITAAFSGKAGIEGEVVVAKAVSPVNVELTKANVRTGIKNQAIGDIVITEAMKEAFTKDNGGMVELQLSDGVDFSEEPTIEVVEGNLDIKEDTIEVENGKLTFQIDSESTRASKIKISNVKVDLDRTVAEGDIEVEVGGNALVENHGNGDYQFDKDYVAKKAIATVVTPAQGNERVGEVKFAVGSTSFVDNGVEMTMDVAPFIEASRTYLPVRYVAKSVGVDGENILWDEATRKVTIIKDARVAQLTIGSNVLTINGANIPMDVKAQIKDGRTVLPLRAVAQALGAQVDWNEADRTVTVK